MSTLRFCRSQFLAVVFTGIGAASLSVANAAPDACAALTVAELSSALGQPVGPPAPSENGDGGGECMYLFGPPNQTGLNQLGVEVYQFRSAAEAQKWFSNKLANSDDAIGSQKPVQEPGVGDGAFSKMGVFLGSTKAIEWVAVHGTRGIQISVITANLPSHDRLRGLILSGLNR
jgi:hypothetical protein